MDLGDIIEALTPVVAERPDATVRHGFDPKSAGSWRGSYSELSFYSAKNVLLADMLNALINAIGETYEGYKGGMFTMHESCDVYMDGHENFFGDRISWSLVRYWIDEAYAA